MKNKEICSDWGEDFLEKKMQNLEKLSLPHTETVFPMKSIDGNFFTAVGFDKELLKRF